MQQEIAALRNTSGSLTGHVSVGVIPSALPMAALMTKAIQARHPGVELTILSQSSIEILRHLEDFSIDVGLPAPARRRCARWSRIASPLASFTRHSTTR